MKTFLKIYIKFPSLFVNTSLNNHVCLRKYFFLLIFGRSLFFLFDILAFDLKRQTQPGIFLSFPTRMTALQPRVRTLVPVSLRALSHTLSQKPARHRLSRRNHISLELTRIFILCEHSSSISWQGSFKSVFYECRRYLLGIGAIPLVSSSSTIVL